MKKVTSLILAGIMLLGMCSACGSTDASPSESTTPASEPSTELNVSGALAIIQGYEWGPAVSKVVLEFPDVASDFGDDTFEVLFGSAVRTIQKVYSCDEEGAQSDAATKYIAIEMTAKYGEGSPFVYKDDVNQWPDSIKFNVTVAENKSFRVGGTTYQAGDSCTCAVTAEGRRIPQTASWIKDTVDYQEDGKDITLSRAAWAPEGADSDSGKNPLIIWLHGAGEGGTDIDIALLGNEVTALTTENETNVQKYFVTDDLAGAYVLAVQVPGIWMDEDGQGTYNDADKEATGKQESWYTEALWKAITTYVESNPDIDTDRIYLGGCSNGGYMTMNLMFEHGDYFAAYYPVCQAYLNGRISDEMLDSIKDRNIWFLLSADDQTVEPPDYTLPLYVRLLEAGAKNVWLTITEQVLGTDDPNPSGWFGTGHYDGHWSWIYVFNDQVTTRFDPEQVSTVDDLVPENCTITDVNLWAWLAAQSRNQQP